MIAVASHPSTTSPKIRPSPPVFPVPLYPRTRSFPIEFTIGLIHMTVKDYAPCLIFQGDDPGQTLRSTSISA